MTTITVLRTQRQARARRVGLIMAALAGVLALLFAGRLMLTRPLVPLADLIAVLSGEYIAGTSFIVWESSLPRDVLGLVAGLALGASGAAMQQLLGNPLASPDVLGVTGGASAAAVAALVVAGWSGPALAASALAGSALVVAIMLLVGGRGTGAPARMILVGVGLGMVLTAITHAILTRASIYKAHDAMVWLVGSLARASWTDIGWLSLAVAVLLPALLIAGRSLNMLTLGPEMATSLGVNVPRQRALITVLVVALIAAVTAVCGPIAFVPLLAGPLARALHGGRTHLPTAALIGACIVIAADHLASQAIANSALPAGVVTGLVGAPTLLALVARTNREVSNDHRRQ